MEVKKESKCFMRAETKGELKVLKSENNMSFMDMTPEETNEDAITSNEDNNEEGNENDTATEDAESPLADEERSE